MPSSDTSPGVFADTRPDLPTDSAITALNLAFSDMTGEFAFKGEHTTDGTLTPRITYFTGRVSAKTPGDVSLNGILTHQ